MQKIIYVIGHKNPDTDSCVSAYAYAHLKRAIGLEHCFAARAGKLNPQTEYIFERFNLEPPIFLPDLVPKVKYYQSQALEKILYNMPLWDALAQMNASGGQALPIVDELGAYKSLLHYSSFAQNILKKINPHKKAVVPTSVAHLIHTIKAQPITIFDEASMFKAHIVVAALEFESFTKHLKAEMKENCIIVVGDRVDIQKHAIETGVRAVIVTNGASITKEIRELAEKNKVSIMVSPFDTSSTSLLIIYSTPVHTMGDDSITPLFEDDLLRTARSALNKSHTRCLPVIDEDNMVTGMLTEGDLIKEPSIEIIMVDHNENSQAIEGIENYRVLEIIDHHRLGSVSTKYPITFINKPVGSTSTIIAGLYRELHVPLTKEIASILLCGILSDTLVLQSATTTEIDSETAEYLSNITDLEINALGQDILNGASSVGKMLPKDIVHLDMKEYIAEGKVFSVSQIEVTSTAEVLDRKTAVLSELSAIRLSHGYYFSSLMVTDITDLSSILIIDGDKEFLNTIWYPKTSEGIYVLKDTLSRKKQLVPVLIEIIEKILQ